MRKSMDDAEGLMAKVDERVTYWQNVLKLDHITLRLVYTDEVCTERTYAETTADWEYLQADIKFYLARVASGTDERLDEVIIHELVHVMMAPFAEEVSETFSNQKAKNIELATENITRAIRGAHSA